MSYYESRRPDVAVFIDFENVYVSVRDKLNANPNFEAIMDRCSDLGRVVISKAYADWYRYPRVTSALYANAIEPIYVATYYYDKDQGRTGRAIKNSVDMNLCIDAMKTLFTNVNISRFVLVTGDRDFIPLVNSIRQQGKEVYIIGIGGAASTHLAQSADEFLFYEQLVGKQPVATAAAAAIANRATEFTRHQGSAPVESSASNQAQSVDVHDVLVEAIHLVRKRGYVSTLGSIKLVMKELMGGDFKESRYRDLNGRPFSKFKDFVLDADKRGKVQIFTNGTVNEVFLPGEDPYQLSQFAAALSEDNGIEEHTDEVTAAINGSGSKEKDTARAEVAESGAPQSSNGRRRRRRSRRGGGSQSQAPLSAAEGEELDFTAPLASAESAGDELKALDALEGPAEVADLHAEATSEELEAADIPPELLEAISSLVEASEALQVLDPELLDTDFFGDLLEADLPELDVAEGAAAAPADAIAANLAADAPPVFAALDEPESVVVEPGADAAASDPVAETVAPGEAVEPAEPVAEAAEAAEAVAAEPDAVDAGSDQIEFSPQEWELFRSMMAQFSKPTSFASIFDALREVRKNEGLARTNEQLRTMVKQAINHGILERSGRGKRIYYGLKQEQDG
jgi:uncharacterized protein (TIGR00288 family)